MSCLGLAAQDQAATSPDGVGRAGLRCLPSLLLPPAKCSCKNLLTPPAAQVSREKAQGEGAAARGAHQGCGDGLQGAKGSLFPTCPHAPERPCPGDSTQGLASIWEAPWGQEVPRGSSGEALAHSTLAGLWQPPPCSVLGRAEFELLLERSEQHFPWGCKRAQLQTLHKEMGVVSVWVSSAGQ